MYKRYLFLFTFWLVMAQPKVFTQEFDPYVTNSFRSQQVISMQTVRIPDKNSLNLNIQHKFGMINLQDDWLEDFFGMDLTSNIRLGFYYRLFENVMIGVGRTKYNKTYDIEIKYKFLTQRKDNRVPVSAAIYMNAACRTAPFPPDKDLYYPDSITPFTYKSSHQWNYQYQLIIDRKICSWFSLEAAPLMIYRNLARTGESNYTFAIPLGGRVKLGLLSSLLIEYSPVAGSHDGVTNPAAIAYEVATTGHSFQIFICNNYNILAQNMLTSLENVNPMDGRFFIGFNLHRRFWLVKNTPSK